MRSEITLAVCGQKHLQRPIAALRVTNHQLFHLLW